MTTKSVNLDNSIPVNYQIKRAVQHNCNGSMHANCIKSCYGIISKLNCIDCSCQTKQNIAIIKNASSNNNLIYNNYKGCITQPPASSNYYWKGIQTNNSANYITIPIVLNNKSNNGQCFNTSYVGTETINKDKIKCKYTAAHHQPNQPNLYTGISKCYSTSAPNAKLICAITCNNS